ncbi:MAG: hypothetical protein II218_09620 [Peptococcaceae bacterium]|nr:hypothetical protein [Peptococcaceae bacterium]
MRRFIGIGILLLVLLFVWLVAPMILEEYRFQQRAVKYDYVQPEQIDTGEAPLTLEEFGVTIQKYRYFHAKENGEIGYRYVDSTNTGIENMDKAVTLDYGIWYGNEGQLDNQLAALLKRSPFSKGKLGLADYDYGASVAQWVGGRLILRYDDCIICFYDDTTLSLIDSEEAAAFLREKFGNNSN